ncbi:MAG: RNA polymerase sigma-70 factor [Parabacteroides sp.]|nr:RNA polymerase sigma-70 factor [Parabacteroides sp.]MBP8758771.1 RNA polymerase sigma-70 factor [Parabacteroides sp.]MBP9579737.1 RNA polymerase sigma-70 factor [Parabacteroides sp.]
MNIQLVNRDAFDELFRCYYPRLISYISSILDSKIAEDIAQDVFLYVWENRKKIYFGQGFQSYLFQSGYTRAMDYLRKQHTVMDYAQNVQTDFLEIYEKLARNEDSILDHLYSKDFYQTLHQLLDKIPEQRRNVFLLAYVDGLKSKDIAEQCNMSQRTVESHIYLTLKFLRERLLKKDFYIFLLLFYFSLK